MDLETSVELIHRATMAGMNLYEVAHYNSGAHNEGLNSDVVFGRLVQEAGLSRDQYVLAMKLWLWNRDSEPLEKSLDHQLDRVGTDFADIAVLGHYEVPAGSLSPEWDGWKPKSSISEIVHEVADLISAGKVRGWAVCNWSASTLRQAYEIAADNGLPLPQYVQLKYNVARRTIAENAPFKSLFAETGITLQPGDALEGGFLAGKTESSRLIGRDAGGIREKLLSAYPAFSKLANSLGASSAQLALAFCLAYPPVSTVLMGTTKLSQLEDNLGAIELFTSHGESIREAVDDFWLDKDLVEPSLSS